MNEIVDDSIIDNPEEVISILNNKLLSLELREKYLNNSKTELVNIEEVKEAKLRTSLVQNDCVSNSTHNIFKLLIFDNYVLKDYLRDYINDTVRSSDYSVSDFVELPNSVQHKIRDSIVFSDQLNKEKYEMLISCFDLKYDALPSINIPEVNMSLIIKNSLLKISRNTIKTVELRYPNLLSQFIESDILDYYDVSVNSSDISNYEIDTVLKIFSFIPEHKIEFIERYGSEIMVDPEFGDQVNIYLIEKYSTNVNYLTKLVDEYGEHSKNIKETILSVIYKSFDNDVNIELTKEIFNDIDLDILSIDYKIKYLSKFVSEYSDIEIIKIIRRINIPRFIIVPDSSKVILMDNPETRIIMSDLNRRRLVSSLTFKHSKIYGNKSDRVKKNIKELINDSVTN